VGYENPTDDAKKQEQQDKTLESLLMITGKQSASYRWKNLMSGKPTIQENTIIGSEEGIIIHPDESVTMLDILDRALEISHSIELSNTHPSLNVMVPFQTQKGEWKRVQWDIL
jgi:hypothetical protein